MSSTKIAKIILSLLLVQIVLPNASANDDEYFQKSIFRALKEKNGQFKSEMRIVEYDYGHRCSSIVTNDHEEKFSFKTNIGAFRIYQLGYFRFREHSLYVNGTEIYTYSNKSSYCYSETLDKYGTWYYLR